MVKPPTNDIYRRHGLVAAFRFYSLPERQGLIVEGQGTVAQIRTAPTTRNAWQAEGGYSRKIMCFFTVAVIGPVSRRRDCVRRLARHLVRRRFNEDGSLGDGGSLLGDSG